MSVYNKYKLHRNVFVSHCYGAIHTLRLLNFIYSKEKTIEGIAAVIILDLGARAPVSLGLVGKLPAFVLGMWSDNNVCVYIGRRREVCVFVN